MVKKVCCRGLHCNSKIPKTWGTPNASLVAVKLGYERFVIDGWWRTRAAMKSIQWGMQENKSLKVKEKDLEVC